MRVTTKGQVTIPKHIRDHLGIGPGSEVEFSSRTRSASCCRPHGDRGDWHDADFDALGRQGAADDWPRPI